jgi:hypothetical protein
MHFNYDFWGNLFIKRSTLQNACKSDNKIYI